MAEEGHKVILNMYDLSQGLARQLSAAFLGKTIEAIWHTGIVVYGNEYFFGGGIQHCTAGTTQYGKPIRVVDLGVTHIPQDVFESYLDEISPRYTAEKYSLLSHNCNNFSNEVAQFLVDTTIPDYILQLPTEVLNSPMGALVLPMIQNIETTLKAGAVPKVPQFVPATKSSASTAGFGKHAGPGNPSFPGGNPFGDKTEAVEKVNKTEESSKPSSAVKTTEDKEKKTLAPAPAPAAVAGDPLGAARIKVQEEITQEFTAIMATRTLSASEAAAMATRKVMQKYGHLNAAAPQG